MWIKWQNSTIEVIFLIISKRRSLLALQRNSGYFDFPKTSHWILPPDSQGKRGRLEVRRPLAIPGSTLRPNTLFTAKSHFHWTRMEQSQFLLRTSFVIYVPFFITYLHLENKLFTVYFITPPKVQKLKTFFLTILNNF